MTFRVDYTLPSNYDKQQLEKQQKQLKCPHTFWSTRCGICTMILASDVHIRHHTPKSFKMDNRVAIVRHVAPALTLDIIKALSDIRDEYDELTVLTTAVRAPLYGALSCVTRVSTFSEAGEKAYMKEYRSKDVAEIVVVQIAV